MPLLPPGDQRDLVHGSSFAAAAQPDPATAVAAAISDSSDGSSSLALVQSQRDDASCQ